MLPRFSGKILLIDDIPVNITLVTLLLEQLGCDSVGLTSPREALEEFRRAPADFAAAITDQVMPEISGLELARELRAIRPDLPVVLVTGDDDLEITRRARKMKVHLQLKPLSIKRLATILAKILPLA